MTFEQAYNYITSFINIPRKEYMNDADHCEEYLQRLQFFLDIIGNPEKQIPHYVHATGTSGKGSFTLMLQSILLADGKHVGATISPHVSKVTQRWKINGVDMTEEEFVAIVAVFKPALEQYLQTSPYEPLSYFELSTAICLYHFAQQGVQWAILEVGLGGRYDSTNVIPRKDVAVISTIGLDHTHILGETKEAIAFEKAGIITHNCPVFTMVTEDGPLSVIEDVCTQQQAPLHKVVSPATDVSQSIEGTSFVSDGSTYHIPVLGQHQVQNAELAIAVAKHIGCRDEAITEGLANASLPVRMEIVSRDPFIILDSAHNPQKMASSIETLSSLSLAGDIHLLLGFSGNKDVTEMLEGLTKLSPKTVACTRNTVNQFRKVASPKVLANWFSEQASSVEAMAFFDPAAALAWSKARMKKHDILLVTGSVFLAGEIRTMLTNPAH